jgi:hypothetical protein
MTGQESALLAASSSDAPGIKLLAIVIGILLMVAAIRGMFGKRKNKR